MKSLQHWIIPSISRKAFRVPKPLRIPNWVSSMFFSHFLYYFAWITVRKISRIFGVSSTRISFRFYNYFFSISWFFYRSLAIVHLFRMSMWIAWQIAGSLFLTMRLSSIMLEIWSVTILSLYSRYWDISRTSLATFLKEKVSFVRFSERTIRLFFNFESLLIFSRYWVVFFYGVYILCGVYIFHIRNS